MLNPPRDPACDGEDKLSWITWMMQTQQAGFAACSGAVLVGSRGAEVVTCLTVTLLP